MEHVQLGVAESAIMFALMAAATEVRNPDLRAFAPELTKPRRERLNDLGLIESDKVGGAFVHSLTDDGWAWCATELDAPPPKGSQPQMKTLYAVLAGVGRYLAATDTRLFEVFAAQAPVPDLDADDEFDDADTIDYADVAEPAQSATTSVRDRIIGAYHALATQAGAWVTVTNLRAALPDIDASTLDAELVVFQREPGVSLIQQENRALLTDADRGAAVLVGAQLCHLLAIEGQ